MGVYRNQWGIRSLENYILEELMNYNSVVHSQSHCASFSLMELNWFSIDRVLLKNAIMLLLRLRKKERKQNVTCFSDEACSIMKHVSRKFIEKNLSALLTQPVEVPWNQSLNPRLEIVTNFLILVLFKEKHVLELDSAT